MIDHTHDPSARSWVASANGHRDFPLQNLPLGVFAAEDGTPRCGMAIGDKVLDLSALGAAGLLPEPIALALANGPLNRFLALGGEARRLLRHRVFSYLQEGSPQAQDIAPLLRSAGEVTMLLPLQVGGYTDFFAGIVHASNAGKLFRPDNPLLPNYKHVPIGYHGRTSSIRMSGAPVRRPLGQTLVAGAVGPAFGPARQLDYEVELGVWIGSGNELGSPVPIAEAGDHIAGLCLLNDWSARDIQAWEYQPLGPFLAKNFGTTISPWIVTVEALVPFRSRQRPRPAGDPSPLPYLLDDADQERGALLIEIEVSVRTQRMRDAGLSGDRLGRTDSSHLYWTPAQLVAHHTSNGCNLQVGDLLGTGTISAPTPDGYGSLLELTNRGQDPITLSNGEERGFLQDGDEIVMTGICKRNGFVPIGFGECRAAILPPCPEI